MLASIQLSFLALAIVLFEPGVSQSFKTSTIPKPLNTAELNLPKATSIIFGAQHLRRTTDVSDVLPPKITGLVNITSGCLSYNSLVNQCMEETIRFTTYAASDQALCLCYYSESLLTIRSTIFDNYISNCAAQLSTARPAQYRTFTSLDDFCSRFTDIQTIDSSTTSRSVSPSRTSNPTSAGNTGSSTPTNGSPGGPVGEPPKGSISNLKRGQIIGITVGCSGAGLLAAYAIWARYRKKRPRRGKNEAGTLNPKVSGEPKVGEEFTTNSPSKEVARVASASDLRS